jgi:hypothetical protein
LVIEIIKTPHPVKAKRPSARNATAKGYYEKGNTTTYVHAMLGQRTIPLYKSHPECGERDDGWCDWTTFGSILAGLLETANYNYACFGDYPAAPYGNITNGVEPEMMKRSKLQRRQNVGRKLAGGMGSGLEFRSEKFLQRT